MRDRQGRNGSEACAMSYIQEVARDALQAAHTDQVRARRTLVLVAGVLALIHLLTVYPYLEASREIAGIETSMASNAALLAQLEPETLRLREAGDSAGMQLTDLLDGVTDEMVDRFAALRSQVERALRGEPQRAAPPADATLPVQQMQLPQANMPPIQQMQLPPMQLPDPNMPPMQAPLPDFPPMQQMAPDPSLLNEPYAPSGYPGSYVAPELEPILAALAAQEPDAYDRLIDYARRDIVAAAYGRAQRSWSERIRPDYLSALAATEASARQVAATAPEAAAPTVAALLAAADAMARQRAAIEAIEISHDATVDQALGTDWWRTVQGKGAYANAVTASIERQMSAIAESAAAPSAAIRETLGLQEELRGPLRRKQEELARQFAEQREQLAALSGTAGVVPVDLASFIGLFPLVLGLGLGFMLLRAGEARRQAALAAADLARAAPDDPDTRFWLVRRALGGGAALVSSLVTIALAIGALAWIALASLQVAGSPVDPPLMPWSSGAIAILLVLVAVAWDVVAIRRLAAQLKREPAVNQPPIATAAPS
jgi:hypothetical protein